MSTMTELYLIVFISFIIPIAIYFLCSKVFKKTWINIPVFIVLLLYSMFHEIFLYQIQLDLEIKIIEDIVYFFTSEGMMVFYFLWLPAIISFILTNIIGAIIKKTRRQSL